MADQRPPASDEQSPIAEVADSSRWRSVPGLIRSGETLPQPWADIFGALARGKVDDLLVVAQCGQSLDGRVATPSGHSHYINGSAGLDHLHRLRAIMDAVVIGVGTVIADDPQLTVRHVAGPSPVRVVIDPRGTLPAGSRAFAADGVHRIVITGRSCPSINGGIETIALPDMDGRIEPAAILDALQQRGLRRILVEGGAQTVSTFLAAGCLDRLHLTVAPMILGAGVTGLDLPPTALRVPMRAHTLGSDVLFDCDLRSGETAAR